VSDTISSSSPRTGATRATELRATSKADVRRLCGLAQGSAHELERLGREDRAAMLDSIADTLENNHEALVTAADDETALGTTRLNGELTRTTFQFRFFAEVLREGSYLEATIDHAGSTAMGPRPDLRRMLVPLGAVGVFGASNFPFAFSVPGGDTASALAAGCPVVVKAHEAHPLTSQLSFEALRAGIEAVGAPADAIQIVYGRDAGAELVADPDIHAVGFTGSLGGGEALLSIIEGRDEPIPFYGELSGLNPLVVTPRAAEARGASIAPDLVASFTLGAGQFCTKPGLAFIPTSPSGDEMVALMTEAVRKSPAQYLLTTGIASAYEGRLAELGRAVGVTRLAVGDSDSNGFAVGSQLFTVQSGQLSKTLTQECFGPVSVIVRYGTQAELLDALGALESSLTTSIHLSDDEAELPSLIEQTMRGRTGRFVYNGYPTGVAVAWAQHHGGPWPSTNSLHTSVGATAIRRFLRPVAWQSAPQELLPAELRDGFTSIPRRVDGVLTLPTAEVR
jgi:NADP-dependent aldehyde dehydrogenase